MTRTTTTRHRLSVVLAYFLIYVVWGSTYYFIGVALRDIPTFLLGALRFSIAGLLLLSLCALHGEKVMRPRLIRRSAVSGIVLLFVDMAVIMLAQRYVSSSLVAIVASSTAIWIMLLDVPYWKKNFRSPAVVAGILAGFAGVGMLYMEQLASDASAAVHREYGCLILIGGCISWALGTLYAKYRSSETEEVNAFAGAAWQMIFASALFWVCAFAIGDVAQVDWTSVSAVSWGALIYLILLGSLLAYTAYVWLLKVRPATEVATHAYVNPVVAVVIGVYAGHEEVSLLQLTGLAVILLSVVLVEYKPQRQKHAHEKD
ncbi:EamA family transporter [Bacteroides mediterraneensis]|uniref:EamA family transporter n=1 Tax=Bacteroides mediterraneensis TaxID=1841856 RepID=A0ABS2ETR3_9BACE|nr:EamA family transporter [Bacteroides mediterraneensis]MBM6758062.1 EamA family transporter [Bacteroides mediterraneensis]